MQIKSKILLSNILIFSIIIIAITLINIYIFTNKSKEDLSNLSFELKNNEKLKLQNLIDVIYTQIEHIYDDYKKYPDKYESIEEVQKIALNTIETQRYGNNDYFWINNEEPRLIMHPYFTKKSKPKWYEKDGLKGFADPNGVYLFVEAVKVCKKKGRGYVEYSWHKPGKENEAPYPKLSYVKIFKPWGWIIGTGIYIDEIDEKLAIQREKASETVLYTIIIFSIIAFIGILIGFIINFVISNKISQNIKKITNCIDVFSKNNLKFNVDILSKDETGKMADSIVKLRDNINNIIKDIFNVANTLASSSTQLNSNSSSLSDGAQTQASNVEEVSATMTELSNSIMEINENAQKISEESEAQKGIADESQNLIELAIGSMEKIKSSSARIEEITKVISEIADQTNLLSLNASIEAARAGEYGRGFSVVADEISNLADRSSSSTKEVRNLVKESYENVLSGVEAVNQSAKAFQDIFNTFSSNINFIRDISHAIEQQAEATDQVKLSMLQITDVVQSVSASAEETSASTDELRKQAERLQAIVKTFTLR